jgi:hypothetical protein
MAGPQHRTPEYRAARKAYTAAQQRGEWHTCAQPICVMGTRDIAPTQPIDVAHDESATIILGPAHRRCNRVDGAWRRQHPGRVKPDRRWAL